MVTCNNVWLFRLKFFRKTVQHWLHIRFSNVKFCLYCGDWLFRGHVHSKLSEGSPNSWRWWITLFNLDNNINGTWQIFQRFPLQTQCFAMIFVKSSLAKMERGDPVSMMIALSLLPRFRPSIMNGCTAALPSAALSNHRLAPSKLPICSAFLIVHFVDSAFSASSASFLPGISGWTFPGVPWCCIHIFG